MTCKRYSTELRTRFRKLCHMSWLLPQTRFVFRRRVVAQLVVASIQTCALRLHRGRVRTCFQRSGFLKQITVYKHYPWFEERLHSNGLSQIYFKTFGDRYWHRVLYLENGWFDLLTLCVDQIRTYGYICGRTLSDWLRTDSELDALHKLQVTMYVQNLIL